MLKHYKLPYEKGHFFNFSFESYLKKIRHKIIQLS